jgi:NADPH:quinone reductase-like Zn-dependent oxidoreductase
VTAVGAAVTQFDVGDEVFGAYKRAFAEYVAVPESAGVVWKLAGSAFEEAAAVPVAALTALGTLWHTPLTPSGRWHAASLKAHRSIRLDE